MLPKNDNVIAAEDARASLLVLEELGRSLRLSLDAIVSEAVPSDMGLLLLRMAIAEVLRSASKEEALPRADEPTGKNVTEMQSALWADLPEKPGVIRGAAFG